MKTVFIYYSQYYIRGSKFVNKKWGKKLNVLRAQSVPAVDYDRQPDDKRENAYPACGREAGNRPDINLHPFQYETDNRIVHDITYHDFAIKQARAEFAVDKKEDKEPQQVEERFVKE